MKQLRSGRPIEIVFHRSFRRPVKILANAESPHSAVQIPHHFPAGVSNPATRRARPRRRKAPGIIRLESLPQMDWRILGDHDPELFMSREEVAW